MLFFLALALLLMLVFPEILIIFVPALVVLILPFVLFKSKYSKPNTTPELSLEAKIWQSIKKQYPDAIQWCWANSSQEKRFEKEGSADIDITNWDLSVGQFVISRSTEDHFWINEKISSFSNVRRVFFGTIPTDIDTDDASDPVPDPVPNPAPEPNPDTPDKKEKPKSREDSPVPAPRVHHGRPAPMPIDYSALAFEWVTAHLAEISEQLSIALDAGEDSCLLDSGFLPKQEAWKNVAEELNVACDLDTEITDIGIVISQKQAA